MPEQVDPNEYARRVLKAQSEADPPVDIEFDDNGKVISPPEPKTLANLGQRITEVPSHWFTPQSDVQQAQNTLKVMQARNAVDQRAIPLAESAKANSGVMKALSTALTYRDRVPEVR